MEDVTRKQDTLDILGELRQTYKNVGTVIQSYLYCASDDVKSLENVPLRIVKGAYKESEKVAYIDRTKIDENYIAIIKQHLRSGSYTAIASHDHEIINKVKEFCKNNNIAKSQFEFQMLYGFRTNL
jgi:proline dehydrogenase